MKLRVTVLLASTLLSLIAAPLHSMDAAKNDCSPLSLCSLPREVLEHIADSCIRWRDIEAVRSTCKYLHANFHAPMSDIIIDHSNSIGTDESQQDFLNRVLLNLLRCKLHHANPIVIILSKNHLCDRPTLDNFFIDIVMFGLADRITALDLSNNSFSSLPNSIKRLQKLAVLDLSDNAFDLGHSHDFAPRPVYPSLELICSISTLKKLSLAHNHLRSLPDALVSMPQLELLNIANNVLPVTEIEKVGAIKTLTTLNLCGNKLKHIPDSICTLPHLTSLDLSDNQLERAQLLKLGNIKSLKTLYIDHSICDKEMFALLTSLLPIDCKIIMRKTQIAERDDTSESSEEDNSDFSD